MIQLVKINEYYLTLPSSYFENQNFFPPILIVKPDSISKKPTDSDDDKIN